MKTLDLVKGELLNKKPKTAVRLEENKVRVAIGNVCKEFLKSADDVLTFESRPSALDSTLTIIEEPALTSRYEFCQLSETLFQVRLKEIKIL